MKMFIVIMVTLVTPLVLLGQTERWVYVYNGLGSGNIDDRAQFIACGPDGNTYTAGWSTDNLNGTGRDFVVVSTDSGGTQRWVYRKDGYAGGSDRANRVIIGEDGYVYACGTLRGEGTGLDFSIVSLDTAGNERWVYTYAGPLIEDEANAIVHGSDGNIYATGRTNVYGGSEDFLVVSVDTAGNERWTYSYAGNYGNGRDIVFGLDGRIYATGVSRPAAGNTDFLIVCLDTAGNEAWTYSYAPTSSYERGASIIFGADWNIYATGHDTPAYPYADFVILSVDTGGNERWVYSYDGPAGYNDGGHDIIYGTGGNVYAAGYSSGINTDSDYTIISVDTSGVERWVYRHSGTTQHGDNANQILHAPDGHLYSVGTSYGADYSADLTIASVDTAGNERWMYKYAGANGWTDAGSSIDLGIDGNLYAAGISQETGTIDICVVSVTTIPASVDEFEEPRMPSSPGTITAFPNPFSTSTTISRLGGPENRSTGELEIGIYNAAGRLIQKLQIPNSQFPNGSVVWDAKGAVPGIYFLYAPGFESLKITKILE